MSLIALLDCNNFFVSCERLFRPDLRNRPVVVLSSNDGCVVARSKEIKDKGIPMGVPYFQIKDILDEMRAVCFSSHFSLYRDVSRRVFEVVAEFFSNIEQYSIDECFFNVDKTVTESDLNDLKRQIEKKVGIPVSIGVAASKTRAKYANAIAKKTNKVIFLNDKNWTDLVAEINLNQIWGVGRGRTLQFAKYQLKTVKDFLALEPRQIFAWFGSEGLKLYAELNGQSVSQIEIVRPKQKSIMSTRSFGSVTTAFEDLEEAIKHHIYHVARDLNSMNLLASRMIVMITPSRYGDYFLHGRRLESVFTTPTANLLELQREALMALKSIYQANVPYQKAGVLLTGLVEIGTETRSLFAETSQDREQKSQSLDKEIYRLNERYGKPIVKLGSVEQLNAPWQTKKANLSPAYTTRWSDLKIVRC